eukprot:jgi/Tetstr1/462451/TSEL_007449.t2
MDDFLFLARTQAEAIWQRDYIERHLSGFGLLRNPNKGVWEPTQKLVHLGCQFLYLAIAPARFYLRELHDVMYVYVQSPVPTFGGKPIVSSVQRNKVVEVPLAGTAASQELSATLGMLKQQQKKAGGIIKHNTNVVKNMAATRRNGVRLTALNDYQARVVA